MKKIISKIKNRRLKGNVSLLVIFILLASSVIALLSINQIQHLLTYWNMTFNYFRAFYLAKAWTELWLTEVYYREAWFNQKIGSWHAIVSWNLVWAYSWFNPYFTMNITWEFKYLTNDIRYTTECSGENKITLGTWEWIMLSLFWDTTDDIKEILSNNNGNDINKNIRELLNDLISEIEMKDVKWEWQWTNNYFTFWLFDYDEHWDMKNIYVETWSDTKLKAFLNNIKNDDIKNSRRRYLTIKNSWTESETVSFCIFMDDKFIPYSDSLITVRGNYGDMEVWLQSVVKKTTPSWSLNVLWL